MVEKFDQLIAPQQLGWKLLDIMPKVLVAGTDAGHLTVEGAKLLDPSGHLKSGIPLCPPEGDAGLEKELSKPYEAIDMVTTPDGSLVGMVHCNNCTSEINAWIGLFKEYQEMLGVPIDLSAIYEKLFKKALEGDADCGGLMAFNYVSGEPVTGFSEGRPLFMRSATDKFNLANFMRAQLYAAIGVLKIGNDILFNPRLFHFRNENCWRRRCMGYCPSGILSREQTSEPVLSRFPRLTGICW